MDIELVLFLIFMIVFTLYAIVDRIMGKKDNKKINFDEFTDIEKITGQEEHDKKNMEYESEILDQVYKDAYNEAYIQTINGAYKQTQKIINTMFESNNNHSMSEGIDDNNLEHSDEASQSANDAVNKYLNSYYKNKPSKVYEKEYLDGPIISKLKENGYHFDVELFKKWSRQIFGCIKAGTDEQLKIVKEFMSEELYNKLDKQRKLFAKDGLEFVTEDLYIEKCKLYDYGRSLNKEEIKIYIKASMKEYIIKKDTQEVLRGDNEKSKIKNIIMTFVRKNVDETEGLIHNCPNCGAEVKQTEFGKCRYCNTLVVPIRYNWTLTKFETL